MIEGDIAVCMGAYEILMGLNRDFAGMYKICIYTHILYIYIYVCIYMWKKQHGS